jgi:hypothetical protein
MKMPVTNPLNQELDERASFWRMHSPLDARTEAYRWQPLWSAVTCHRFHAGDLSPSNIEQHHFAERPAR